MPPAALLLALAAAVSAAPAPRGPLIAEIRVERLNVFDPAVRGEDIWPFRLANRIHFMTREAVVRRELLLGPGDPWDPLRALETERNMRALGIFRKAEIRPEARPDGRADLVVRSQDSWTLNVQLSAGTEGGENFFTYGVAEDNLLGYGKSVRAVHSQTGADVSNDFRYGDARFLGSRVRLGTAYSKTNRGDSLAGDLARPFFSLETPRAFYLSGSRSIGETSLKADGADGSKFLQRSRHAAAAGGLRLPFDGALVSRAQAGWYYQKDVFEPTADTLPRTLPEGRELSGPTLGYSWVEPRFIKETYIDKMERVEDFNLGNELRLHGGFTGKATGSDRDRWVYNAVDSQGLSLGPGRFALAAVGAAGRMAGGEADNTLLYANLNLFWKASRPFAQTWVGHLEINRGRSLDGENQVILGGNTGLRGYKNNSFTGSKSLLLNLENRVFLPGEYFHLFRFGAAAFFDSGAVAPADGALFRAQFKSDVGAGLRVSSTRSRSGGVVRVDLAYALNRGPGLSRWVLSIRSQQAFQIFNSSTRDVRQSPNSGL